MTRLIQIDGVDTEVEDDDPRLPKPAPAAPQTIFDPGTFILTMFTDAERIGFMSKPQGALFATLIAATQAVDIASDAVKQYIAMAVKGGFLTQDRANDVLAGKPAAQG